MDIGKILYSENVGGIDLLLRPFIGTIAPARGFYLSLWLGV